MEAANRTSTFGARIGRQSENTPSTTFRRRIVDNVDIFSSHFAAMVWIVQLQLRDIETKL